jgi:NAD(P) transhydrogenase subunit alpha
VRAFDTRPGVKEQVESMGAEFLPLEYEEEAAGEGGYAKEMSPAFIAAEMALFAEQARDVDIIITTALIPGKPAPVLLSRELVQSMRKGSVIVDLAAENGGNCALTEPGKVVEKHGVTIIGFVDLPSRLAPTASQLYGANLCHLLADMGGAKSFHVDLDDEVIRGSLVLEEGELRWPPPRKETRKDDAPPKRTPSVRPAPHATPAPKAAPTAQGHAAPAGSSRGGGLALLGLAVVFAVAGRFAPPGFLSHLTVFVLACFVGWRVVWNVSPALHTPLMSVTNAISGIILIGGMLSIGGPLEKPATILGALAIFFSAINVAGGFLVTQRMLRMFRR